jgi:hypothetical protein
MEENLMPQSDHANATAIINFAGLLLFRPTGRANNPQCEVKVLKCDRHKLDITIGKLSFDAQGTLLSEEILNPLLNLDEDITISVKSPAQPGVEFYKDVGTDFDRKNDKGNEEDIRWVLDFENQELNGNPIQIGPQNVANPKSFSPTILIDHCKVYTLKRTEDTVNLARENILDTTQRVFLGKAAFRIGTDLYCAPGTTIEVRNPNVDGSGVTLQQEDLTQFSITIENQCDIPDDVETGSDFRFYYDALSTADKTKFDLRHVIKSEAGARDPKDPLDNVNFASDNFPRICFPVGGGTS